jgi:GntR family transcriptional repressor for pyruvate dehydrogenase complex
MIDKRYSIKKTNLYEQIADCLEHEIIHAETEIVKLPSEKDLSIQFNVSKTAIREALKVLKERGLIASKNGEGSFVTMPDLTGISNSLNRIVQLYKISDTDLQELRMVLESAGARKAAQHADTAEIEKMEDLIDKVTEKAMIPEERIDFDAQFHTAIAKSGNNPILGLFVEVMSRQLREFMVKGSYHLDIKKTYNEHKKIVDAIREGNSDKAEQAMQNHLKAAWRYVKNFNRSHVSKTSKNSKNR